MARIDPKNAREVAMLRAKHAKSRKNYLPSMRDFHGYCDSIGESPCEFPMDEEMIMFWIMDKTLRSGSAASICTWTASIAYLHEIADEVPLYKEIPKFKQFVSDVKARYGGEDDPRLPITLAMLMDYTHHLQAYGENVFNIPLDTLVKVVIMQLLWISMARPSEVLKSVGSKTKTGILYSQMQCHALKIHPKSRIQISGDAHRHAIPFQMWRCEVAAFKNQKYKKKPKYIYVGDTRCIHSLCASKRNSKSLHRCPCTFINPSRLIKVLYHRYSLRPNLHPEPNKPFFRWQSAETVTTTHLTKIIEEFRQITKIPTPDRHRYTTYSARIGGATHAGNLGIAQAKLLKYVGWSAAKLPQIQFRYQRYTSTQFANFGFEMLHGPIDKNQYRCKVQNMDYEFILDPWKNDNE